MQARFLVVFPTLLLLPALATAATSSKGVVLQPDKLVILSTTDVKGMTSPCGCHIPKGGLSRRAGLVDSIRAQYGQVALVDDGGFLPEGDGQEDLAGFIMDVMNKLNTDAVGVGERDLRYGASFLRAQVKHNKLPVVCANLIEKRSRKPLPASRSAPTLQGRVVLRAPVRARELPERAPPAHSRAALARMSWMPSLRK